MTWINTAHALSYLAGFLFTLFVPPISVRCTENNVVPYSDMNKTFRDHIRKQRFLKHVLNQLRGSESPLKNATSSVGPSQRGAFTSLLQEKGISSHTPSSQTSHNSTNVVKAVPDKGMSSPASLSPPNLVFSESEEKNILTFKFRPRAVKNKTLVNKIHLWLYVRTKDKDKSVSTSHSVSSSSPPPSTRDLNDQDVPNRRKGKRIKIRVFLSDASGARGQRIAELKTRVEASTWGKLGLPVSLINSLAETGTNNTLRLRIECKRCSGKTQVVMPGGGDSKRCWQRLGGKKNKKGEERKRRLKKQCAEVEDVDERLFPFIVIEEKSKGAEGRFKRELEPLRQVTCQSDVCSNKTADIKADQGVAGNLSSGPGRCCRQVQTYVQFSDLNLDRVIVYPPGFDYVTCIQVCSGPFISTDDNLSRITDLISQTIRHQEKQTPQRSLIISSRIKASRHLNHYNRQHAPLQHHLRVQHHIHHSQPRLHRWFGHKWNRLKLWESDNPRQRNNFVIVFLTDGQRLAQTELPHFVVTRCGCKNHVLSTKDQF